MGNTHRSFRMGAGPLAEAKQMLGLKLLNIQKCFVRFDELSRLPGVDIDMFAEVFPMLADPHAAFNVFDVGGRGRIDILEVFAAISLASDASPNERKKFTFQFYDFDGSKALTFDELIIMLRSVLVGVAKLTNGSAPSMAACEEIAKQAFVDADSGKDGRVTYVEFSQWVRNSDSAKALLSCFDRRGGLKSSHRLPKRKKQKHGGSSQQRAKASESKTGKRGAGEGAGSGSGAATSVGAASGSTSSKPKVNSKGEAVRRTLRGHFRRKVEMGAPAGAPSASIVTYSPKHKPNPDKRGTSVKYAKSEIVTLKKLFDRMDTDQSGSVDVGEFSRSLNDRMLAHMRGMFQVMDKDQSGTITFEELLAELYPYASEAELKQMLEWVKKRKVVAVPSFRLSEPQITELKNLFDCYDLNRSGTIDMEEMFSAMAATGVFTVEEIRETFAAADVDRNAMLSFSEFKQFFKDVFGAQELSRRHPESEEVSA